MRRLAALFSTALLVVLIIWYTSDHGNKGIQGQGETSKQLQTGFQQIIAEDLSLTTTMFIGQLKNQLLRWSEYDLSNQELYQQFEKELTSHQHFEAFAVVENEQLYYHIGEIQQEDLKRLTHSSEQVVSSDPYLKDGNEYMLVSCPVGTNKQVVGEVNLSFVKKYVRNLANVVDANGNLFIGSGDTDVNVENGKKESGGGRAPVPELGWNIVVKSQENSPEKDHYIEHEAIISFVEGVDGKQWLKERSLQLVKNGGPYYVVRDQTRATEELVRELSKLEEIDTVEPNYFYTKQQQASIKRQSGNLVPNDEFYQPYQWNLSQIFAEIGWNITSGAKDVPIAILDSGVDAEHEDLKERIKSGYNSFLDNNEFYDEHGHGTHVAGIIAATTNNETGIAGVSWFNPLLAVKVLNEEAEGSAFEVARGIRWATDHGAKVINMSLGDSFNSKVMYDAIRYAYNRDVVLIAAAGNDNVDTPMYPAAYDEVIAVSAVNDQRQKATFSNYGQHIGVAAPGEHIPSTFIDNSYVMMSGTSMAAPHVAGMAGLIRSLMPDLTNQEVMKVIYSTANDIGDRGFDPYFGYGEINVVKALQQLKNYKK